MRKPSEYEELRLFYKGPLSQWHKCQFEDEGVIYNCAEQYMMFQKAQMFGDTEAARLIIMADHPRAQKSLGRTVKNFVPKTWDMEKYSIVYKGNMLKFGQNEDLANILFDTYGTRLVEASPYDRIWGIGLDASDPRAKDPDKWMGLNLLGDAMTEVRDALMKKRNISVVEMVCNSCGWEGNEFNVAHSIEEGLPYCPDCGSLEVVNKVDD